MRRHPLTRSGRGCLRWSCLGCIGLVLAPVVIGLALLLVGWLLGRPDPEPKRVDETRALPSIAAALPGVEPPPDDAGQPGRIVLDVRMVELEIVPGPAGEPLHLEADYDGAMYELRQELTGDAETGWEYRLRFGPRVSWLRTFNREFDGRLRLVVPRGTPVELSGSIGLGKSVLELGGLHVTRVDLDVGWGDHELRFSEPTAVPVQRIRVGVSMGKTILSGLGNASAAEVELRQGLGDVRVGLDGAWRVDAHVVVRQGMGQCVIHAPDDVRVDVERGRVGMGQRKIDRVGAVRAEGPVVHLDAAVKVGGLKVER